MKRLLLFVAAIVIMALPNHLNSSEEIVPVSGVASAYANFGFRLYEEASRDNDRSNILVSPLSLALATAVLYNGAAGETMKEIKNTLGLDDISLSAFNEANKALLDEYSCYDEQNDKLLIQICNSLWMSEKWQFKDDFKNHAMDYYEAETFLGLDKSRILEWIKDKTMGKIYDMDFTISPNSAAIIVNTIYYNNAWAMPFMLPSTFKSHFYLCDNTQIDIQMMIKTAGYLYFENDTLQAVELDMAGHTFSTLILLPGEGICIDELKVDAEVVERIDRDMKRRLGILKLPRFKVEYESKLRDVVSNMGMVSAFKTWEANFEEMAYFSKENNFYIDDIIQKTVMEVTEEGIEAGVATVIETVVGHCTTFDKFEMIVNRPFYIIIRDNQFGLIFFMGAIYEPVAIMQERS